MHSFASLLREISDENEKILAEDQEEMLPGDVDLNDFPLMDALDRDIIMHRESHFSGSFPLMIEYYKKNGAGVSEEFDIQDVERLALLEHSAQVNFATLLLNGVDIERIARAKNAYKKLKELYTVENPSTDHLLRIADLILAEHEDPEEEIERVVAIGKAAVPGLIALLRSDQFYDPLFPGYGAAPTLAVQCLGRIGHETAIAALFEALEKGDYSTDEEILKAFSQMGEPAIKFALKILKGRPINKDNERAAMICASISGNTDIAEASLQQLQDLKILSNETLSAYLVLSCYGLQSETGREAFKQMTKQAGFPSGLQEDAQAILKSWFPGNSKFR